MTHRPDAESPKKPAGRMSPSVLLNAVRHYPLAFAGLLALTAVVVAGVWLFMPLPKHTAAVVYHVSAQAPRVISAGDGVDAKSYRDLQQATVKNRLVLNAALNELKSSGDAPLLWQQPDQMAWLDKNLQVDFRGGNEFMRVYLEGDNPDEMLAIVKAVAAAYQEALENREKRAVKQRQKDIDDSYKTILGEIDAKQKRIDRIALSLKASSGELLAALERDLGEDLRVARKDLADVLKELDWAKPDLPADGKPPAVTVPAALIDQAVAQEPAVLNAEQAVTRAKDGLAALQGRVAEGGPGLNKARAEAKAAEEARDKIRAEVRAKVESAFKERAASEAAAAADQKRAAYAVLVRKRQQAEAKVKEALDQIEQHGQYRLELGKLQEDIGGKKKLVAALDDERNRIGVEERLTASRVIVHEPPFTQPGIEGFRRLRTTLVAGIGLFVVGFAGLAWWEHRSRRVIHSGEVADSLGLPLLGTLPPWAADQPGGHGELVEAIDSTRTVLLHGHTADRPLRTLVVTSALPGEGKTSLSGHLAVSLARAGYRTLLVDGDVREPAAHKVFDLPPGPGLCEVLREEVDPTEATRDTKVPGLSVMPAGKWSFTVRQALVGDRWGSVRRQLERQFDFVVMDTAPLLLVTDSLLLARGADGVVLSVLKGVSRIGSVAHTRERLSSLGARVLGVVVNGARSEYTGGRQYGRYSAAPAGDPDPVPLAPA